MFLHGGVNRLIYCLQDVTRELTCVLLGNFYLMLDYKEVFVN